MNQDPMQNDKEWTRIAKILFPKPAIKGSEAFVTRVMARLEDPQPSR